MFTVSAISEKILLGRRVEGRVSREKITRRFLTGANGGNGVISKKILSVFSVASC